MPIVEIPDWAPELGAILDARYRLEEAQYFSAAGLVYRAHDEALEQTLAVEYFHPQLFRGEHRRHNVLRVQRARAFVHPHIVALRDVTIDEHRAYVLREPVDGVCLKAWMLTHGKPGCEQALRWLEQIVSALDWIHQLGAHGNLGPSTVYVAGESIRLVEPWSLVGVDTVQRGELRVRDESWDAPEQRAGRGWESAATDVYHLALLFAYLATGRCDGGDWRAKGLGGSPDLEATFARATEQEPGLRHVTPGRLLNELREGARSMAWTAGTVMVEHGNELGSTQPLLPLDGAVDSGRLVVSDAAVASQVEGDTIRMAASWKANDADQDAEDGYALRAVEEPERPKGDQDKASEGMRELRLHAAEGSGDKEVVGRLIADADTTADDIELDALESEGLILEFSELSVGDLGEQSPVSPPELDDIKAIADLTAPDIVSPEFSKEGDAVQIDPTLRDDDDDHDDQTLVDHELVLETDDLIAVADVLAKDGVTVQPPNLPDGQVESTHDGAQGRERATREENIDVSENTDPEFRVTQKVSTLSISARAGSPKVGVIRRPEDPEIPPGSAGSADTKQVRSAPKARVKGDAGIDWSRVSRRMAFIALFSALVALVVVLSGESASHRSSGAQKASMEAVPNAGVQKPSTLASQGVELGPTPHGAVVVAQRKQDAADTAATQDIRLNVSSESGLVEGTLGEMADTRESSATPARAVDAATSVAEVKGLRVASRPGVISSDAAVGSDLSQPLNDQAVSSTVDTTQGDSSGKHAGGSAKVPAAAVPVDPKRVRCPSGMAKRKRRIKRTLPDGSVEKELTVYCIERYEYPGSGRPPRTDISLSGAKSACRSRGRRLCTRSEWRRSCGGRYPYGKVYDPLRCNTVDDNGLPKPKLPSGAKRTCRAAGIYDMVGNVAEWTAEGYVNGGSAYKDGASATCRRSSRRTGGHPYVGFRCCADPKPIPED